MGTILLFMALAHQMVLCSLAAGEEIRLINGTSRCSGTVEILYKGQWGRVCGQMWDVNDANVVCGQLGCGRAVSVQGSAHVGQGSGGRPTWLDDVGCKGTESSLTECSHGGLKHHDCLQAQDARVVCSVKPNIRLVNGSDLCSGRVEVYQTGHWRTVCDDVWDLNDAAVVCRQLACGRADSAPESAYFGQGSGPIWQDDVGCSGTECSITQCSHTRGGTHNCEHGNDAGVICSGVVLQKPSLSTDPSYSAFLHGEEVQLTCTLPSRILCNAVEFIFYLNGDSVMNVTVGSSQPRATLAKFKMDDSHQGSYSCLYRTLSNSQDISSPYSNVTKVVLIQPNISLSAPNGGMFWDLQGPEVIRGHSFSIICSIHPQYPGGLFYLDFSGSNRTETTPAVNHSACFHFPVAEYKDQGKYSCSYGVNISTRSFRSANSELAVTIRASMVLIIASGGTAGLALLFLLLLVICLVSRSTRRSSKPSTETDQRECIDNRHNRGEDNKVEEEEEVYVNVENVCDKRSLERGKGGKKKGKEKGHSYGKTEDACFNEEEGEREGNVRGKRVCGGSHEKVNSAEDDEDYATVYDNVVAHDVNEDIYQNY
ncbi:deleted in malignant brain tumors 1 protein-like [Salvelinus fontinalis]|uniref:deleted in malignant brain tumors 1 protein-like n=1 Tax=Salvelinus fontinalis TaxID=8038 RepID=UPI002486BAEA|nr:deleted in malignant brain tumors 1 protein-like [Salvelinus fontinalis]XP_055752960.1 deleted in malignant brain tumors 1 protein-like [Salvelinus fontinalis]